MPAPANPANQPLLNPSASHYPSNTATTTQQLELQVLTPTWQEFVEVQVHDPVVDVDAFACRGQHTFILHRRQHQDRQILCGTGKQTNMRSQRSKAAAIKSNTRSQLVLQL
jgi:hypothetical protein